MPKSLRASHSTGSVRLAVRARERFENIFRKQRNRIERNPQRVLDGIDNRRSRTIHRKLADSLGAKRAVNVTHFLEKHADGRQVGGSGHDVIRHLAVLHAPILPNHFLVQRISDPLRDAARDLPSRQNRMQHLAHLLQRHEIID